MITEFIVSYLNMSVRQGFAFDSTGKSHTDGQVSTYSNRLAMGITVDHCRHCLYIICNRGHPYLCVLWLK